MAHYSYKTENLDKVYDHWAQYLVPAEECDSHPGHAVIVKRSDEAVLIETCSGDTITFTRK